MPYNVVQVRLQEGPMMFANIINATWDTIPIGAAVEVSFEDVTDEITLPKFRLA